MRFNEIKEVLKQVPITWLPALIVFLARQCKTRAVFRSDDGLLNFIKVALTSEEINIDDIKI